MIRIIANHDHTSLMMMMMTIETKTYYDHDGNDDHHDGDVNADDVDYDSEDADGYQEGDAYVE